MSPSSPLPRRTSYGFTSIFPRARSRVCILVWISLVYLLYNLGCQSMAVFTLVFTLIYLLFSPWPHHRGCIEIDHARTAARWRCAISDLHLVRPDS